MPTGLARTISANGPMNHGGPVVGVRVQRSHAVLFRTVALSFAQQGDGTYQNITPNSVL